jgi:hypothetical protein
MIQVARGHLSAVCRSGLIIPCLCYHSTPHIDVTSYQAEPSMFRLVKPRPHVDCPRCHTEDQGQACCHEAAGRMKSAVRERKLCSRQVCIL